MRPSRLESVQDPLASDFQANKQWRDRVREGIGEQAMIEISAVDGASIACPHCQEPLARIWPHAWKPTFPGVLYHDSDDVPVRSGLAVAQCEGFGWDTSVQAGTCPFCEGKVIGVAVAFTDAEPDEETERIFFHRYGDRGEPSHFRARRGELSWIVTRYDTPVGPMLEHEFGPFPDPFAPWVDEYGIAAGLGCGPWEFARELLAAHWDELRTMPKALGLEPGDPRAVSWPPVISTVLAALAPTGPFSKRLYDDGDCAPSQLNPRSDEKLDDDIPF